jgi:hypothetical protein
MVGFTVPNPSPRAEYNLVWYVGDRSQRKENSSDRNGTIELDHEGITDEIIDKLAETMVTVFNRRLYWCEINKTTETERSQPARLRDPRKPSLGNFSAGSPAERQLYNEETRSGWEQQRAQEDEMQRRVMDELAWQFSHDPSLQLPPGIRREEVEAHIAHLRHEGGFPSHSPDSYYFGNEERFRDDLSRAFPPGPDHD